jgi:hypothetical protein
LDFYHSFEGLASQQGHIRVINQHKPLPSSQQFFGAGNCVCRPQLFILHGVPGAVSNHLAHLFRAKELLAYRLATCHNLTFTLEFMARIRRSIEAGTFPVDVAGLRDRAPRMGRHASVAKSA